MIYVKRQLLNAGPLHSKSVLFKTKSKIQLQSNTRFRCGSQLASSFQQTWKQSSCFYPKVSTFHFLYGATLLYFRKCNISKKINFSHWRLNVTSVQSTLCVSLADQHLKPVAKKINTRRNWRKKKLLDLIR